MFGPAQFARMKHGAIFLNLSRGFLVDYAHLRDAIKAGDLAGAAVDVFPEEPKRNGDPFESELRGLPNVILTPHVGGSTEEAQQDIGVFVAGKLRDYMRSGSTALSVNLPRLTLDTPGPGRQRIAHLHRNVPGVLAAVNQALSSGGANIDSQMLATTGDVGYSVTDISGTLPQQAKDHLREIEGTISVRELNGSA